MKKTETHPKSIGQRKWAETHENTGLLCHTPSQMKGQKAPNVILTVFEGALDCTELSKMTQEMLKGT